MLVELGRISAWMVILLMARDITITALRSMASGEGVEMGASYWGKKKTAFFLVALGFLLVHYPTFGIDPHSVGVGLLWVTLLISLGSGAHYIFCFFREVLVKKKQV
jgi:CDP-diacylglycerol--glycerol-3-phosphate 3-phosphatidyltransferase